MMKEKRRRRDHKRSHQRQPFWVHETKDKSRWFSNKWKKHLLPNIWNFIPENQRERRSERERRWNWKKQSKLEKEEEAEQHQQNVWHKMQHAEIVHAWFSGMATVYTGNETHLERHRQWTRHARPTQREGRAWKRHSLGGKYVCSSIGHWLIGL